MTIESKVWTLYLLIGDNREGDLCCAYNLGHLPAGLEAIPCPKGSFAGVGFEDQPDEPFGYCLFQNENEPSEWDWANLEEGSYDRIEGRN